MTSDIIFGLLRHVLTIAGGYYVAHGKIDQDTANTIIGAVCSLAGVGWSIQHKVSSNS